MMDKTTVMIEFSIYGDNFEPDYITNHLGIRPSETYLKGELIRNGRIARKETAWTLSTGYEVSTDINVQLKKLMLLIENKLDKLETLKDKIHINMLFMVVVKIENKEAPAMYLEKPFIDFLGKLEAEVGFDIYIYS